MLRKHCLNIINMGLLMHAFVRPSKGELVELEVAAGSADCFVPQATSETQSLPTSFNGADAFQSLDPSPPPREG